MSLQVTTDDGLPLSSAGPTDVPARCQNEARTIAGNPTTAGQLDSAARFHDSRCMEIDAALRAFGALSQGTRLEAFCLLIKHEPAGIAAGELARLLSVPQNTLSAHLNVLSSADLVTSERRSRSIIYRAQLGRLEMLLLFLLKDCCDGRPDVCAEMIASVTRQLSAKVRGR